MKNTEFDLKMCGKKVYVTYFEYWDKPGFNEKPLYQIMRQSGKDDDGIKMCIQAAKRIAERGSQIEALGIIANSSRVELAAREKARNLLCTLN